MRVSGERKRERGREIEENGAEQSRAAACCPHQAPLRIFHREFTSLDTTGKLQEWRSNLSLLASVGSLFFSQVPSSLEHPPLLGRARARARKLARPRKCSLPYYAQRVPCRSKKIPLSSPLPVQIKEICPTGPSYRDHLIVLSR